MLKTKIMMAPINFQISGLDHTAFDQMFKMNVDELAEINAVKIKVNQNPGFPCRVSLEDANIGEEVILFTYEHHQVNSPYRSKGPIYIRENVTQVHLPENMIPEMLLHRFLSLRVYDANGFMIDARALLGKELRSSISQIFKHEQPRYIHVHNAAPGCFNCEIIRS